MVQTAIALHLSGIVENLGDGRVKVIAEGDEDRLKWFEEAIDIKNTLIQVSSIEKEYSDATGDFAKFYKLVEEGETDSRLDTAAVYLKELISEVKDMNKNLGSKIDGLGGKIDDLGKNLGGKMDQMLDKQDMTIQKQDQMLQKQDVMIQKQDQMLTKQDQMLLKQDRALEKQDELLVEVKDVNRSFNDKADQMIKKQDDLVRSDIAEIKTALKAKGIM